MLCLTHELIKVEKFVEKLEKYARESNFYSKIIFCYFSLFLWNFFKILKFYPQTPSHAEKVRVIA